MERSGAAGVWWQRPLAGGCDIRLCPAAFPSQAGVTTGYQGPAVLLPLSSPMVGFHVCKAEYKAVGTEWKIRLHMSSLRGAISWPLSALESLQDLRRAGSSRLRFPSPRGVGPIFRALKKLSRSRPLRRIWSPGPLICCPRSRSLGRKLCRNSRRLCRLRLRLPVRWLKSCPCRRRGLHRSHCLGLIRRAKDVRRGWSHEASSIISGFDSRAGGRPVVHAAQPELCGIGAGEFRLANAVLCQFSASPTFPTRRKK